MEYDILYAGSQYQLILLVNDAIKKGWKPLGGVVALSYDGDFEYNQTMIKENQ